MLYCAVENMRTEGLPCEHEALGSILSITEKEKMLV